MKPNEIVFDQRTFDDQPLTCPKCGWKGIGSETHILDFYGIGKFKEVTCPKCDEYLGNLSRENLPGESGRTDPGRP